MNQWKWCITDSQGKVIKGWYKDDDSNWYFLNDEGVMQTGWIQDKDGKWYYLYPQNTTNYGINYPTGAMAVDWVKLGDYWYYFLKESDSSKGEFKGQMVTGNRIINGKSYTFDENGHMLEDNCNGLSDKGAEFLASWEGISYKWEDVGDGYWTIGIGTATSGTLGKQLYDSGITSCTLEQAKEWARQECESCYETIKAQLDNNGVKLNQNQIDALISLSYNIGVDGLIKSTLFKNILSGVTDSNIIRENFGRYNLVNGKVWQGLVNRRKSEADLYINGDYTGNK